MRCVNQVIILGYLGQDAEVRYLPSGIAIASMNVATQRSYKNGEEWKTETEWHNITAFGHIAEQCAEKAHKGDAIFVEGRLQTQKYEKEGIKRWTTKIIADNISFLNREAKAQNKSDHNTTDDVPF